MSLLLLFADTSRCIVIDPIGPSLGKSAVVPVPCSEGLSLGSSAAGQTRWLPGIVRGMPPE